MIKRITNTGYALVAPVISSSQQEFLKIIAILTMFIAHLSVMFSPGDMVYYGIGRIAFPLFAFLMVYNYIHHTSSPIKYIFRILAVAIVAQAPYKATIGADSSMVNIMFALAAGLFIIYLIDYVINSTDKIKQYAAGYAALSFFLASGAVVDYIYLGLIMIIAFWAWLKYPSHITMSIAMIATALLNFPSGIEMILSGLFSFVFIGIALNYNFKIKRINKWAYYAFYPLHLIIIQLLVFLT